jgi:SEC-C motif
MEKVGRNDPCPCGSGKKFKKCCESKAPHSHLLKNTQVLTDTSGVSSLFHRHVAEPKKDKVEE